MDPQGSIWFHFYVLKSYIWLTNLAGDHLEPSQGPLVVPGPPVENPCITFESGCYHCVILAINVCTADIYFVLVQC